MKSQSKNSEASPVFSVRGLSKTYRAGDVDVHALRGVNLDLYAGEFVVLLGQLAPKVQGTWKLKSDREGLTCELVTASLGPT